MRVDAFEVQLGGAAHSLNDMLALSVPAEKFRLSNTRFSCSGNGLCVTPKSERAAEALLVTLRRARGKRAVIGRV